MKYEGIHTCCIKQPQGVRFTSNHNSDSIIVKYLQINVKYLLEIPCCENFIR